MFLRMFWDIHCNALDNFRNYREICNLSYNEMTADPPVYDWLSPCPHLCDYICLYLETEILKNVVWKHFCPYMCVFVRSPVLSTWIRLEMIENSALHWFATMLLFHRFRKPLFSIRLGRIRACNWWPNCIKTVCRLFIKSLFLKIFSYTAFSNGFDL